MDVVLCRGLKKTLMQTLVISESLSINNVWAVCADATAARNDGLLSIVQCSVAMSGNRAL